MPVDSRAHDWLKQAEDDLKFARVACREGFFAQCCFITQQSAEKALKAILFSRGARAIMTHSLVKLCRELGMNDGLSKAAGVLDQYYLSGRYPDALPGGAPFEVFTEKQAKEALAAGGRFIRRAGKALQAL